MNIFDKFTNIDELLVSLLERIGGVTEEDTHFFSYPNDGTRATITKGTTTLDFMGGTVMTPAGEVANLGNSLRARGREYCRSLSLQADRAIIIQIGTKSKIPVFAGTWFKVAHLRFTDVKIIAAEDTRVFVIACTNPDSIEMAGEAYVKDPVDDWGKTTTIGNAEATARSHAPPIVYDRRGEVVRWTDFESPTIDYDYLLNGTGAIARSTDLALNGDFTMKSTVTGAGHTEISLITNDYHLSRVGGSVIFSPYLLRGTLEVHLRRGVGAGIYFSQIRYTHADSTLKVYTSGGWDTIDAAAAMYEKPTNFSTMKLVADMSTNKYVRALLFGNEYDLTEYDMVYMAIPYDPHIATTVEHTYTAANSTLYIENIILTENEPI